MAADAVGRIDEPGSVDNTGRQRDAVQPDRSSNPSTYAHDPVGGVVVGGVVVVEAWVVVAAVVVEGRAVVGWWKRGRGRRLPGDDVEATRRVVPVVEAGPGGGEHTDLHQVGAEGSSSGTFHVVVNVCV